MPIPIITKANVRPSGLLLDVEFNIDVDIVYTPAVGDVTVYSDTPDMNATKGQVAATYSAGTGGQTITYQLSRTIFSCEVVAVEFKDSSLNNGGDRVEDMIGTVANGSEIHAAANRQDGELKCKIMRKEFNQIDWSNRN